jgi:hypothetical protein
MNTCNILIVDVTGAPFVLYKVQTKALGIEFGNTFIKNANGKIKLRIKDRLNRFKPFNLN